MRKIEQKMIDFIDAKLASNGSAQDAILNKNARELFGYAVESMVGIREKGGNNRGPLVDLINETVGIADGGAWCMALQQTAIAYVEHKLDIKSPIYPSEHCMTVWQKTPKAQRVKTFPARFAIIIWIHGKGPAGHTGIFIESPDGGKTMITVEGNTESGLDSKGKVEREGGGVYKNKRSMKANGSMKVVGWLKPF